MNKQLIRKYKAEFDHWLNGGHLLAKHGTKGWISYYGEDIWRHPTEILIIIDDEYVEFRTALAEGKIIQYYECVQQHETCDSLDKYDWVDWKSANPSASFSNTLMYRIKPEEPQFPCYYKEKSSGIVVKFSKQSNRSVYPLTQELGIVIDSNLRTAQKTLGFEWRCWDTFSNPERWEHLPNYKEKPKFKVGDWVSITYRYDDGVKNTIQQFHSSSEIKHPDKDENVIRTNFIRGHYNYVLSDRATVELWQPQPGEGCWFYNHTFTPVFGQLLSTDDLIASIPDGKGSFHTHKFENCAPFTSELPFKN